MKLIVTLAAACGVLGFAVSAAAEDVVIPRMIKGMPKGQWKAEVTESSSAKGKEARPTMILCTDNLMQQWTEQAKATKDTGCKRRLVKDTSSEAVMESVCAERTSTVTMKKDGEKSLWTTIDSSGKQKPFHMKIHYTHLGACAANQPAVSYPKGSEQCKRIDAAMAKMDPAKNKADIDKMKAMCR